MNEKDFIEKLTEIIDTEKELTLDTELKDVEEWDSVSMVSFFSFCTVQFPDTSIQPNDIKTAKTVRDLFKIVEAK